MGRTEHGSAPRPPAGAGDAAPLLVLTLTRACNLRCGFCPLELGPSHLSPGLARRALELYFSRIGGLRPRIRFFGGEPLLRFALLRELASEARRLAGGPGRAELSFPTNGTLLDEEAAAYLARHPDIEVSVSRVPDVRRLRALPNLLLNVCVPPAGASAMGAHVLRLLRAGFRRLNFLPAYFTRWSAAELAELERGFRAAAALLRAAADAGRPAEVRNVRTLNPAPLFNHGVVVDTDGSLYASNAALCEAFAPERPALKLGDLREPGSVDWRRADRVDWAALLRRRLAPEVYASTMEVDRLLGGFVERLASAGLGGALDAAA